MNDFILFSGSAHPYLADSIARILEIRLGARTLDRFPDGEISVRLDQPVRGHEVFLLQPTSPPVNENLMELLALVDACRRASAGRITALVPYFGYSRADKRHGGREPITGSLVAQVLQAVGIDHLVALDLHAPQIEGFFQLPVDTLTAIPALYETIAPKLSPGTVVVSPDEGRVRTAIEFARRLKTSAIVLHKQRATPTETHVLEIIGEVKDKPCLIVDDMISTGSTLAESIDCLLAAGARPEITVAATHGVLVKGALEKLRHPALKDIYVTDSLPIPDDYRSRLRVVSIAPLLAAAIRRFVSHESISSLYQKRIHNPLMMNE